MVGIDTCTVERWLGTLFIGVEGARLRVEDRRKAVEVAAMLSEIGRALSRMAVRMPITLVDAAAGKSYLGLLAAKLLLEPMRRRAEVLTIEKDPRRVELSRQAALLLNTPIPINCRTADLAMDNAWPERPAIIAALHACGPAADEIIAQTFTRRARMLLLVPCCTGKSVAAARRAEKAAARLGVPRHAPVRRRFVQAWVDAERTLRLEAAGYETEVVEFVAPTITPHNLLWRARLVAERRRMMSAAARLDVIMAAGTEAVGPGGPPGPRKTRS
jgi:hypothetical protein